MTIYALDPGPARSAVICLEPSGTIYGSFHENEQLLHSFAQSSLSRSCDLTAHLVIEQVACMGMPVGAEVFETVFWSGRFAEAWASVGRRSWSRLPRRVVKLAMCGTARATDATIRQALIDHYGPGKAKAVGLKASPGPLYGIKADLWQALALAVTYRQHQQAPA